jgi:hypothetical protein
VKLGLFSINELIRSVTLEAGWSKSSKKTGQPDFAAMDNGPSFHRNSLCDQDDNNTCSEAEQRGIDKYAQTQTHMLWSPLGLPEIELQVRCMVTASCRNVPSS